MHHRDAFLKRKTFCENTHLYSLSHNLPILHSSKRANTHTLLHSYTLYYPILSYLKIRNRGWGLVRSMGAQLYIQPHSQHLGILVSCDCLLLSIIPPSAAAQSSSSVERSVWCKYQPYKTSAINLGN